MDLKDLKKERVQHIVADYRKELLTKKHKDAVGVIMEKYCICRATLYNYIRQTD